MYVIDFVIDKIWWWSNFPN